MANNDAVAENRRALISTIRECDLELIDLKAKLKDVNEELTEHVAGFEESKEVKRLKEELEQAKNRQAAALTSDPDFNELMDQKADLNREIKDTKEVLSSHVVAWKTSTGEDQVEYDDVMGKEVIVSGKLGKLQRYQTNIFSDPKKRAKIAGPLQGMQDMADKHGAEITISGGGKEVTIAPKRGRGRPKKVDQ